MQHFPSHYFPLIKRDSHNVLSHSLSLVQYTLLPDTDRRRAGCSTFHHITFHSSRGAVTTLCHTVYHWSSRQTYFLILTERARDATLSITLLSTHQKGQSQCFVTQFIIGPVDITSFLILTEGVHAAALSITLLSTHQEGQSQRFVTVYHWSNR